MSVAVRPQKTVLPSFNWSIPQPDAEVLVTKNDLFELSRFCLLSGLDPNSKLWTVFNRALTNSKVKAAQELSPRDCFVNNIKLHRSWFTVYEEMYELEVPEKYQDFSRFNPYEELPDRLQPVFSNTVIGNYSTPYYTIRPDNLG